jgi:phosphoenolpyruvate phosphomutase
MQFWAGVHDPLTARLVSNAGFDAGWLGSNGVAAAHLGLPDDGQLTPDIMMTLVERIRATTDLPLVVDAENGYGESASELCRIVRRLADAGADGVCIEDSVGPKQCSLWDDTVRTLRNTEAMSEYLGELVANRPHPEFRIVARTEALIEGEEPATVSDRIDRYGATGVWATVVHFRRDITQVFEVTKQRRHPGRLVIIPTNAPEVPARDFAAAGFSVYVAAHVSIRAAAAAIDDALRQVLRTGSLSAAAERAMSIDELDRVLGRRTGAASAP